jgi:hypothetical protein
MRVPRMEVRMMMIKRTMANLTEVKNLQRALNEVSSFIFVNY